MSKSPSFHPPELMISCLGGKEVPTRYGSTASILVGSTNAPPDHASRLSSPHLSIADCHNRGHLMLTFLPGRPLPPLHHPSKLPLNFPYGSPTTSPLPLGLYLQLSSLHAAIALLDLAE